MAIMRPSEDEDEFGDNTDLTGEATDCSPDNEFQVSLISDRAEFASSDVAKSSIQDEVTRNPRHEAQRAEFLVAQADPEEQRILRESFEFMETIDDPC